MTSEMRRKTNQNYRDANLASSGNRSRPEMGKVESVESFAFYGGCEPLKISHAAVVK